MVRKTEGKIAELQSKLEDSDLDLTLEEFSAIEEEIEELEGGIEDDAFIDRYGWNAYYGVSDRDFR
jgi:hypothetical protein